MTSSNGPAVPPRFYAFSALVVVAAVGVTWAVARTSAPPAPAPVVGSPATPDAATYAPQRATPRDVPRAEGPEKLPPEKLPPSARPTAQAPGEHDAMVALADVVLPAPVGDGGGVPLPLPTRAELALVAPLTEGQRLGDAQVVVISRVDHGVVRVISRRGDETIDLAIALASAGDRPAAAKVGRYAIYHYNTAAPSLAASGLVVELATLLRRNVNVPPPPGMTEAPL